MNSDAIPSIGQKIDERGLRPSGQAPFFIEKKNLLGVLLHNADFDCTINIGLCTQGFECDVPFVRFSFVFLANH